MKKALDLAFRDRSIMNRITSNADFSSRRSRNLPSRVLKSRLEDLDRMTEALEICKQNAFSVNKIVEKIRAND